MVQQKWNQRYLSGAHKAQAGQVLLDYEYLLPQGGKSLDLACGLGGNALLLAEKGFDSHAWDISDVAIEQLSQFAQSKKLSIHTQVRDVLSFPPQEKTFDLIVVTHFLERSLAADLMAALRPGGLLYYQTFVQDKDPQVGPSNPHFLLAKNELLQLFGSLNILIYSDVGLLGDLKKGCRNEAFLVAQKTID